MSAAGRAGCLRHRRQAPCAYFDRPPAAVRLAEKSVRVYHVFAGRMGQPEQIASAVALLSRDQFRFMLVSESLRF